MMLPLMKNKKKKILYLLLFTPVFSLLPLYSAEKIDTLIKDSCGITESDIAKASEKKELRLIDFYSLSVKYTERMLIEGENYIQSDARRDQAIGAFLPKISLRARKYYPEATSALSSNQSSVYFNLRQPIITGLDEISYLKRSKYEINLSKNRLSYNAGVLLSDVSHLFYRVIQLDDALKNKKEMMDLYQKTANELRRRVYLGKSRESELLRINSQIYKLKAEFDSLTNESERAKLNLKSIAGINRDISVCEGVILPDSDFSEDKLNEVINKRWDMLTAKDELEIAKTKLMAAWGGHLPAIYVEASYAVYQKYKPSNDFNAFVGAEIPIFSGGITQARIREAESQKRQAELKISQTRRSAEQEIIDAYRTWKSSKDELKGFELALKSAEDNYRSIMREYALNLVTIIDVFNVLTTLQSARDDYDRTVIQNKLSRIRLGIAVNEFSGKGMAVLRNVLNETGEKK